MEGVNIKDSNKPCTREGGGVDGKTVTELNIQRHTHTHKYQFTLCRLINGLYPRKVSINIPDTP